MRLVFNLQNYASNIFYLFLHILSQSSSSLLHPSRVAATVIHRRSSPPLLAQARSIGSSLVLATISILLLSLLPLSFLFRAAPRAFPARCGTARAFAAQRCTVRAQRSARRAWLCSARVPCAALCGPARRENAQRGERAVQHRNARAWRRSFLHSDDSARTRRRLSYRRHTQRRHATRHYSCSAAIDACRTRTAFPAQVSFACPAHPLPAASAARLAQEPAGFIFTIDCTMLASIRHLASAGCRVAARR